MRIEDAALGLSRREVNFLLIVMVLIMALTGFLYIQSDRQFDELDAQMARIEARMEAGK